MARILTPRATAKKIAPHRAGHKQAGMQTQPEELLIADQQRDKTRAQRSV